MSAPRAARARPIGRRRRPIAALALLVALAASATPTAGATRGPAAFGLRDAPRIGEAVLRPADAPAGPPGWSDEFDGDALDATRWSSRASGPRHDGVLTPAAVAVGGGALTITTYTQDATHYSGMIATRADGSSGFEQAYGWFEVRARFASTAGQWSAFWLQSPSVGDPIGDPEEAGVEMDVVEHRARCTQAPAEAPPPTCDGDISDRIQQAAIWDGYGASSQSAVKLSDPLSGLAGGGWHTYALRWTPTGLTFSYDDQRTWSTAGPISRREQYLVLGSEVGSFFAGPIPPGGYGSREASTTTMDVDYVRAWAAAPAAPASTAAPVISGTPAAGQRLTCAKGSWTGVPPPTFARAWLRDGAPIAETSDYAVRDDDRGHALACRVTATNSEGSTAALSAALAIPAPLPPPPAPPPPPQPQPAPAADRAAPIARLSGRTTQHIGPTASVTIACLDEPCRATVAGAVRLPRMGRSPATVYRPVPAAATIQRGTQATVRLRLAARTRQAVARLLRSGRRVVLRLGVRAVDRAGNARVLSRGVAFSKPLR